MMNKTEIYNTRIAKNITFVLDELFCCTKETQALATFW